MKRNKLDIMFSAYIRERDGWQCQRCKKIYNKYNSNSRRGIHCSHYSGRRKQSVRYDPQNADTLCHGCHRYWETEDREGYRAFKIKQLGQKEFDMLTIKANTPKKPDYKMIELWLKDVLIKRPWGYELK